MVDDPANGVTFCTGSLGAEPTERSPAMIRVARGARPDPLHALPECATHGRSLLSREPASEASCGSVDMRDVMCALKGHRIHRPDAPGSWTNDLGRDRTARLRPVRSRARRDVPSRTVGRRSEMRRLALCFSELQSRHAEDQYAELSGWRRAQRRAKSIGSIVFNFIREHQPISRAELARRMNVRRAALTEHRSRPPRRGRRLGDRPGRRGPWPPPDDPRRADERRGLVVAVDVRPGRTSTSRSPISAVTGVQRASDSTRPREPRRPRPRRF